MKRILTLLLAAALLLGAALAETDDAPQALPKGYVLVSTATQSGWLPLPTEGEKTFPLAQLLPDGTEALNVIHLMPDGVYMEDANCANHDCMGQGEVTFDNIDERVLGNMIICLPNQVVLQLYTADEVLALLGAAPEAADPEE